MKNKHTLATRILSSDRGAPFYGSGVYTLRWFVRDGFVGARKFAFIPGRPDYPQSRTKPWGMYVPRELIPRNALEYFPQSCETARFWCGASMPFHGPRKLWKYIEIHDSPMCARRFPARYCLLRYIMVILIGGLFFNNLDMFFEQFFNLPCFPDFIFLILFFPKYVKFNELDFFASGEFHE